MNKESVSSILRALDILECFMDNSTEWTLKNLVDELHFPTTTVYRQISTLTDRGYLIQDPIRKSYRVGPRLLLLASNIMGNSDLRLVARPELEKLSATVKETINLILLMDHNIFYLDKVETFRSIACTTRVGTVIPAHTTAGGKVLLSGQSDDYIDEYCEWMKNIPPRTSATISDPELLRAELAAVKIRGYAIDNGEIEEGLICYGAPIYDLSRQMVAAVSIAGPDYRMQADQEMMIREVKKTAKNISRLFGYSS